MFLITLADFVLGLFVGAYALASFAPNKRIAEVIYKYSWTLCLAFVGLAYLATKTQSKVIPTAQSMKDSVEFSSGDIKIFGGAVILGIVLMFVGGLYFAYEYQEKTSEE